MFGVDGFKRFMVRMHFHVPSIYVLVQSLKSKHDAQHFAFNVGVVTFCFNNRLTGECDGPLVCSCIAPSYICKAST